MDPLQFLRSLNLKRKPSAVSNFWKCDEHDIPASPGVYLLIAKSDVQFPYPAGKSPIYYVGKTRSLHMRIVEQHLKYHTQVQKNCRSGRCLLEMRHEYGGIYGGRYSFIRTWPGVSRKDLEDMLLAAFATKYHAFPVANSAGAWKRLKNEF
jgi:hypothetical protein